MTRIKFLFGCLMLTLVFSPRLYAVNEIQQWHTSSGAKVLFLAAPELPMLDVRVVFAAGSSRDTDKPGLAMLTNAALDAGAGGLDQQELAVGFTRVGAKLSNGSARDMAWVSLRTLSEEKYLNEAIALFAKVLQSPKFAQADLQRLKQQMLLQIADDDQSPGAVANRTLYQSLYAKHAYGSSPNGDKTSLKAINVKDVKSFYQQYYSAKNANLVLVGDLSLTAAKNIAEKISAKLKPGSAAAVLSDPAITKAPQRIDVEFPSSQTHILLAAPGVRRGEKDYFALYVANHILGGSGFASRLMQEVREKRGLAYSAYSVLSPMQQTGPFYMGLQTRADQTEQALQVVRDTFSAFLKQGPTDEEFKAAQDNITGGFALSVDSNRELAGYLMMMGFYDLSLNYLERFNKKIQSLTRKQVHAAMRERFDSDKLITIVVGKTEK